MLTRAPLPEWSHLLNALRAGQSEPFSLAESWRRDGEISGWFSRSAWSLALLAVWRRRLSPNDPICVWIPDYFCNESLIPLRAIGSRIVFYPVTPELRPDYKTCRLWAKEMPLDLFVLVHYQGTPTPTAPARDFCAHHNAWLAEDAAHVLRPTSGIGQYGDFVLYSPHKLLPIPDGAVLIVRPKGPGHLGQKDYGLIGEPSSWSGQLQRVIERNKFPIYGNNSLASRWLIKRLLQKLGVRRPRGKTSFNETSDLQPPSILPPVEMSSLARRLLAGLLPGLSDVTRWRQRHQLLWDELLFSRSETGRLEMEPAERPFHREWTPYHAAYRIDTGNSQAVYERFRHKGLPVATWPDLPPEISGNNNFHSEALKLRHNRIYFPLHQSLRPGDILSHSVRNDRRAPTKRIPIKLAWDITSREQWHSLLIQTGLSNLLQSWSYGEAKAKIQGWKVHRGLFSTSDGPVALVQALKKRFKGGFSLYRVNRGPLFFEGVKEKTLEAVLQCMGSNLSGIVHRRILSWAPEQMLSGRTIALFARMGCRQFKPRGWESAWVDLGLGIDALRANLNGKWRNMLSFAERQDLRLKFNQDSSTVDWIIKRCHIMMQQKGKNNVPIALYKTLQKEFMKERRSMMVFRAYKNDDLLAGICMAQHGLAATYLLGWNGKRGRRLKANQFLLWQAIIYLKQEGFRWLDLGGLDEAGTPGISAFKNGINGERYALVGEMWKW